MVVETDKSVDIMHTTQVETVEIDMTVEIDKTVEIDTQMAHVMAVDIDISVEMTRRSSVDSTDGMARKNNVTIMVNLE